MKKRVLSFALAAVMAVSAAPVISAADSTAEVIKLNPANESPFNRGEFQGWGTSMGWWGNRIGYSDKLAEQAAKLFYSEEGLGLDIVRYNVGGGDDPTHNHVTRSDSKLPCFAVPELDENGAPKKDGDGNYIYSYVWNKPGYDDFSDPQTNVLKKIKEQNKDVHIEGYTNSPPWFMTKTGCSGGGKVTTDSNGKVTAIDENLDPANYAQFAKFVADVTEHFSDIGLCFDSYSPMNEPEPKSKYWGELSPKQEGNHVAPGANQSALIEALYDAYDLRGNGYTIVAGPDETNIDYSITSFNALTESAKSKLGRLDTHTYGGSKRAQLKQTAMDYAVGGINLWMSEVDGSWDEFGLADRIMADLNGMQASAWVLWDIVDMHKDSNFTDPSGNKPEANNTLNPDGKLWGMAMANHDTEEIELTQKYYGYGQFTKYIKPGMTLIESSSNTLAAYDKRTGEIVVVAVNSGNKDKTVKFDLRDFSRTASTARPVRTSGSYATGEHWAVLDPIAVEDKQFTTVLKADSITTFVIDEDATVERFEAGEIGLEYEYGISNALQNYDSCFAVYNSDGTLRTIIRNGDRESLKGDYTGCTFKLMTWDGMKPVTDAVTAVSDKADPIYYMNISGSPTIIVGTDYEYSLTSDIGLTDEITWSVSDDEMAEVTPKNEGESCSVRAKKGGTFTLTATHSGGAYTSVDVKVLDENQTIRIINKKSGLGLETQAKKITSGSLLVQWEDRNLDTAAWKLSGTEDGHFNIINMNDNMILAANADQKPVISNDIDAADDKAKWDLINHGGYYEIKNVGTEKSLNVSGQSVVNGGNVILYAFGGGDNELWSFAETEGELEHVVPVVVNYADKYTNTNYTWVKNISEATNDFEDGDAKGFVLSGTGAMTTDGAGESVLGVQAKYSNKDGQSETGTAVLETPITCDDGQIINVAFDIYCSNSGGTADFVMYGLNDTELIKMAVSDWDKYTMTVAGTSTEEETGAKVYLRNYVNDKTQNQLIANGAHMEIYYKPSTGEISLTLKNNTNNSPVKTYQGTVIGNSSITKLSFAANYTTWSKPMYIDNLVTNIITEK